MLLKFITISYILAVDLSMLYGYTLNEEDALFTSLLTGYNKYLRPGDNRSEILQVSIGFTLITLDTFDEKEGRFSVGGMISTTWTDKRLSWVPSSSNGYIQSLLIPEDQVWVPKINLYNIFDKINSVGGNNDNVRYTYSGQATWPTGDIFDASCDADVTFYPYDQQICSVMFAMTGYSPLEANLSPASDTVSTTNYGGNGVWDLKNTRVYTTSSVSDINIVSFEFTIKRRPEFQTLNMVLPVAFLCLLNSFVFLLPAESGERIGYSITLLLAIAVYMTLITEKLPESAEPGLCAFSYKMIVDLCVGCVITVLTIIGLRFYYTEESEPIPRYLKTLTRLMTCKRHNHMKTKSQTKVHDSGKVSISEIDGTDFDEESKDNQITWVKVTHAFDTICFVFSLAIYLLNDIVYLSITL